MKKSDSASATHVLTPDVCVNSRDAFASFAQHYIMETLKNSKAIGIPALNITITDTCSSDVSRAESNPMLKPTR